MHIDELERYWLIAVAMTLGVFAAALFASVVVFGVSLPSPVGRIDPREISAEGSQFAETGLRQIDENRYEVVMTAQMWSFTPAEVQVPVGSEVTFIMTSRDITHGFLLEGHDINLMLLPGQVAVATTTFKRPGTFAFICHEYCGPGHHNMFGYIIVEPVPSADTQTGGDN